MPYTDSVSETSDRDERMCIMKVIGHIGDASDPHNGTFWVVAQLLALTDGDSRRRKTADKALMSRSLNEHCIVINEHTY